MGICKTTLQQLNPLYLVEWHPTLNEGIDPGSICHRSKNKVWWICPKGHSAYQCSPNGRFTGSGCPICGIQKRVQNARKNIVANRGSLEDHFPELSREWDVILNGGLLPSQITSSSAKKFWWRCEHDHSYQASPANRTRGRGCSICKRANAQASYYKTIVKKRGSLASRYPELLSSWDYKKNGSLGPALVAAHGDTVVWWRCNRDHSWSTQVKQRTAQKTGCPMCRPNTSKLEVRIYSELKYVWPDVNWRATLYGFEADVHSSIGRFAIEVDGYPWHEGKVEFEAKKRHVFLSHGIQMIQVRDDRLPVSPGKYITWRYGEEHYATVERLMKLLDIEGIAIGEAKGRLQKWLDVGTFLGDETYNHILSYLPGPPPENSFAVKYPEASNEWDIVKNAPLNPEMFHMSSNQTFWWICPLGHSYRMSMNKRAIGRGCPYCTGRRVDSSNSLATKAPEMAKYWHYELNSPLTPDHVTVSSNRKVWWQCDNGHEWQAVINRKEKKLTCPYCTSLVFKYPKIAKEFLLEKNAGVDLDTLSAHSNKKVWWQCDNGHEWQAVINSRTGRGTGCPICFRSRQRK